MLLSSRLCVENRAKQPQSNRKNTDGRLTEANKGQLCDAGPQSVSQERYNNARDPGRSYSYSTSSNAIPRSSRVVVVRRGYYGCYGCYYGCYSCGRPYRSCRSRASCSHTPEISTLNNLDRCASEQPHRLHRGTAPPL